MVGFINDMDEMIRCEWIFLYLSLVVVGEVVFICYGVLGFCWVVIVLRVVVCWVLGFWVFYGDFFV